MPERTKPLTEEQILDRAEARERNFRFWFHFALWGAVVVLLALYEPVHRWLHVHVEFFFGMFVGSLLEMGVVLLSRWAWQRRLWLEWMSHQ